MIVGVNTDRPHALTFLGTDYGGWAIDLDRINQDSTIYSFGIGTDISFDEALIKRKGCTIYGFDPTPRSVEWIKKTTLPSNFKFYELGISNTNGYSYFNEPPRIDWVSYSETNTPTTQSVRCEVKKLSTIMSELNHSKIDLLKMDIEGSEYGVLNDMINEEIFPDQIMVEFHGNDRDRITTLINKLSNYHVYKKSDRLDYYLIKK